MKPKILELSTTVLLFGLIIYGCQYKFLPEADKIENVDEITKDSLVISSLPGISIYKTKEDYFNYISLQVLPDGRLNAEPGYILNDPRIKVDEDGNIKPNFRWRLTSGFIVDKDTYINESFTNITIQEYVNYNTANKVAGWPDELIKPRIIDKDPFTEFYYLDGIGKPVRLFTLKELNDMIEDGILETVFTKLK
jgi:hypothetical protein